MSAYVLGNLVGHLLMSYLLVLFVLWLISRFNAALALKRSMLRYGWS